MNYVQHPVRFMGQPIGRTATSKLQAALTVLTWLKPGQVPAEYCPVERKVRSTGLNAGKVSNIHLYPTTGRLVKNTTFDGQGFNVGIGLPDRRLRR
ncbi:hypothetical protein HOU02_gp297 [Caulobacter phage CcrBL9]|uniref:Uncharacterized protein n=1 Tax=Caulobacter phage CcrBL9 TaxID=2283270 RepID=A0A385EF84_9CAUD|nr:hypothetical protein HOU02_gp297 [Caulobacter phage CcrBL9]AXQ69428.1 hypothetical protein CcrBL9_gp404 [Caulobacter phage CcrBL9]